jgi:preprotein translocase subunit SecG|nr:preprotein translocase subunit SecG [Candidatus Acidoferrales bacterium]
MPVEVKWAISFLVGGLILFAGWKVPFLLLTFYILVCIVLAIVVLLQSGTAADLAGAFGGAGSQTAFGPRGAATFLSKATTWCAVMFMITSMLLVVRQDNTVASRSVFDKLGKPASSAPAPAKPAPLPVTPPTTPPPTNK